MVVLTFEIYAKVGAISLVSWGSAVVGFSVDTPLPDKISGTPFARGLIGFPIVGTLIFGEFGPTTVTVNVGTGQHYVILGVEIPGFLTVSSVRLRLRGLGVTVDRTFGALDPKQYVYIAFEVDKNGATRVISTGVIAPGGSPIATPGGGGIIPGDIGAVMADVMGAMLEIMLPMMMFNMVIQMMVGMIQGMVGAFGGAFV
jgi:hypothetical protein